MHSHIALFPGLTAAELMATGTPEYEAIRYYKEDLTEKLYGCYKEVAKYLCQQKGLIDNECQRIIGIETRKEGAEQLMQLIIVDIKAPANTLDSFADFMTAMKKSGNKHILMFFKEKIEPKRKECYRELLRVPAGMGKW